DAQGKILEVVLSAPLQLKMCMGHGSAPPGNSPKNSSRWHYSKRSLLIQIRTALYTKPLLSD
ncbi:MAG: hypothetical protein KDK78_09035, partial [Chlamydiia bacterium]|nr:hypothetical protein [Chlamydiia bacterium]